VFYPLTLSVASELNLTISIPAEFRKERKHILVSHEAENEKHIFFDKDPIQPILFLLEWLASVHSTNPFGFV